MHPFVVANVVGIDRKENIRLSPKKLYFVALRQSAISKLYNLKALLRVEALNDPSYQNPQNTVH
jgi:hypothetical protein